MQANWDAKYLTQVGRFSQETRDEKYLVQVRPLAYNPLQNIWDFFKF